MRRNPNVYVLFSSFDKSHSIRVDSSFENDVEYSKFLLSLSLTLSNFEKENVKMMIESHYLMDDNVMEISTFSLSLSLSPKISLNWQEQ
jgi:hypothetical protein